MSIVAELMTRPGVVAAGEYAYRGDRFSYRGALTQEYARMASIMCRATTLGTHMESGMLDAFYPQSGLHPVRGWLVRGPDHTVCVVANIFCLLENRTASLNSIVGFMRQALAHETTGLI